MNLELSLEQARILNGLLKTEQSNIEKEQEYWINQPELVHVAGSLDDRAEKVEVLQLEIETLLEFEEKKLESNSTQNKNKDETE